MPLGTGAADDAAVLKLLYDWKWRGVMTVEYEHQSPQPGQDVTQSVRFIEDFAASVKKQLPAGGLDRSASRSLEPRAPRKGDPGYGVPSRLQPNPL